VLVLLHEPALTVRLRLLSALSREHTVEVVEPGIEPIRAVRRVMPEVFLVGLHGDGEAALRLLRVVRTDGGAPPLLGVIEEPPHRVGPDLAIDRWGADGWLGDAGDVEAFVADLAGGPRPVRRGGVVRGLWTRIRGALRPAR